MTSNRTRRAIFDADGNAKTNETHVLAVIPKDFKLALDDHTIVNYPAGVRQMPASHFNHWYTKAHGVTEADTSLPGSARKAQEAEEEAVEGDAPTSEENAPDLDPKAAAIAAAEAEAAAKVKAPKAPKSPRKSVT